MKSTFIKRCVAAVIMTAGLVLTAQWAGAADIHPVPAKQPPQADGHLQISANDRCPVCAMYPVKRPRFAAAMTLINGETFYFCGNGCLLRTWLRPNVYLGQSAERIDRLIVLDYFSGQPIDARQAVWIAGSDVVGPMGPALIALGNQGHVSVFQKRHGGDTVFTIDELDDTLWRKISQRPLPPAPKP